MTVIKVAVAPDPSSLRDARHTLRERLGRLGLAEPLIDALEGVANELLGAAFESGVVGSLVLRVEMFARLTSLRVRCPSRVVLRDEPFGMRERVLQGLAFAWGERSYSDGSVDLWAEVAVPLATVGR